MDKREIALQLTLKALETGSFNKIVMGNITDNPSKDKANSFNAEQIVKFYNTVLENLA